MNEEILKKVKELFESGKSYNEIAKELGLKKGNVWYALKKLGLIGKRKRGRPSRYKRVISETKPEEEETIKEQEEEELMPEETETFEVSEAPIKKEAEEITKQYQSIELPEEEVEEIPTEELPPEEIPAEEIEKPERVSTAGKVNLDGVANIIIATINNRFQKAGLSLLTPEEEDNIRKYWQELAENRLVFYTQYSDIVNFALAVVTPIIMRYIEKLRKEKSKKEEMAVSQQYETFKSEQERAYADYVKEMEKLKKESGEK